MFGEFDISGELEAKRSVTKNVRRVVVHREYDASTFENDLALLELESAIHYDTHIGKCAWNECICRELECALTIVKNAQNQVDDALCEILQAKVQTCLFGTWLNCIY